MRIVKNLLDQVASAGQSEDEPWMPDKLFFPLAAVLAGLLVLLALRPALGALPTGAVSVGDGNYLQILVEGTQLNRINAGGEARIDLVQSGNPVFLEIETAAGSLQDDPLLGPHFVLAEDIELQFSGHEIEIAITARPAQSRGATQMRVNYSAGRDGESGWQEFDLTPDWAVYRFTYNVPVKTGERALDYLAIRPVTPDKTRALQVSNVEMLRNGLWQTVEPQG